MNEWMIEVMLLASVASLGACFSQVAAELQSSLEPSLQPEMGAEAEAETKLAWVEILKAFSQLIFKWAEFDDIFLKQVLPCTTLRVVVQGHCACIMR